MQLQIKNILFFVFFFAFVQFNVSYAGDCKCLPDFEAYYKFKFRNGITVATGTLKGKRHGNQYKMDFQGKTTKIISLFYKAEGHTYGTVDINTVQPLNCVYIRKLPRKSKSVYIEYVDKNKAIVRTTKIKASKIKKEEETVTWKKSIFSPMSLYVFFMHTGFQPNKRYSKYVVISDNVHKVEIISFKAGGKTRIETKMSRMKNGKVDASKKVEEVHAWINDLKIPVKMEYKFGMGTIECNLKKLIMETKDE